MYYNWNKMYQKRVMTILIKREKFQINGHNLTSFFNEEGMIRNQSQVHKLFLILIILLLLSSLLLLLSYVIIIIILIIINYSLIFSIYLQEKQYGGRKNLQLTPFYQFFFFFFLKFGPIEIRVNISFYGYILTCIVYL